VTTLVGELWPAQIRRQSICLAPCLLCSGRFTATGQLVHSLPLRALFRRAEQGRLKRLIALQQVNLACKVCGNLGCWINLNAKAVNLATYAAIHKLGLPIDEMCENNGG
jgi:hypothetical protein